MSETTTLDVSRKLRDAGIEMETFWSYSVNKYLGETEPELRFSFVCKSKNHIVKIAFAPTIAELRAYIEQRGEWEEFVAWLDYRYNWEVGFDIPELIDTVMVADSLALAYLGWKDQGK